VIRRACLFVLASSILVAPVAAAADTPIPRPPDSDAPAGAPPHWLPADHWVHHHYVPFDEVRLYALLHTSRQGLWQWLRDDNQTIAQLAAARGWPDPGALASELIAPRARDVDATMLRELRARTLRVLGQGHLAQHVIFHSLHQEAGPDAAAALFGVESTRAFQRLRRLDLSPLQIGRRHGKTRASMQRGLERVLRAAAEHGVHGGDVSERQAQTLLRRQLRQLPRWLTEEHYNGPPQTIAGKPRYPFRPSFASPALAADGSRVLFDAAQPAPALAVAFGEVNLGGRNLLTGEPLDPRDASPRAQEDRPCSSFNASISGSGRVAAYEVSAGNRTFAKRYGNVVIAVADLQAGTLRRVAGGPHGAAVLTAYAPSISGDGTTVAYASVTADPVSARSGTRTRVLVQHLASGRITTVPRAGAYEPAISSDGRKVAFTAFAHVPGQAERLQVYVFDVRSRTTVLASRIPRLAGEAWAPSLSADGRRVTFAATTRPGGRPRIYVRTLSEHRARAISARGRDFVDAPSLSADGTHVAYTRQRAGARADPHGRPAQQVVVRSLLTGRGIVARTTTRPGRTWSGQPQLSADGSTVAFTTDAGTPVAGPGGLRVVVRGHATQTVSPAAPTSSFDGGAAALDPGAQRICDLRPPAW